MKISDPKPERRPVSGPAPEPVSERGRAFLNEAGAFAEFLGGMWGVLAGISVLLPLLNRFLPLIPMAPQARDGAYHILPAGIVTALAVLLALSVLLSTFRGRGTLSDAGRQAGLSLVAGGLALAAYLILHTVKMKLFDIWGVESGHPVHLAFEIPMMALYAAVFALTGRAFVLLRLREIRRLP